MFERFGRTANFKRMGREKNLVIKNQRDEINQTRRKIKIGIFALLAFLAGLGIMAWRSDSTKTSDKTPKPRQTGQPRLPAPSSNNLARNNSTSLNFTTSTSSANVTRSLTN